MRYASKILTTPASTIKNAGNCEEEKKTKSHRRRRPAPSAVVTNSRQGPGIFHVGSLLRQPPGPAGPPGPPRPPATLPHRTSQHHILPGLPQEVPGTLEDIQFADNDNGLAILGSSGS